jgi:hypothetical protein
MTLPIDPTRFRACKLVNLAGRVMFNKRPAHLKVHLPFPERTRPEFNRTSFWISYCNVCTPTPISCPPHLVLLNKSVYQPICISTKIACSLETRMIPHVISNEENRPFRLGRT